MLTFNLKKEWFEKIKSGEKTHEYREAKPYWTKRICNYFDIDDENPFIGHQLPIQFVLGYTREYLLARVTNIRIINGKDTDLKLDADVYDIEFELMEANND